MIFHGPKNKRIFAGGVLVEESYAIGEDEKANNYKEKEKAYFAIKIDCLLVHLREEGQPTFKYCFGFRNNGSGHSSAGFVSFTNI